MLLIFRLSFSFIVDALDELSRLLTVARLLRPSFISTASSFCSAAFFEQHAKIRDQSSLRNFVTDSIPLSFCLFPVSLVPVFFDKVKIFALVVYVKYYLTNFNLEKYVKKNIKTEIFIL